MKVKKKRRRYNSDFATLKKYQVFDDSEGRYVHYGSKRRTRFPNRFSLKWKKITCPHCLDHRKKQKLAARVAEQKLSKKTPKKEK